MTWLNSVAILFFDWRIAVLMLLLVGAAVCDYRAQRIPNWLVLSGAAFGVVYNTALPLSADNTIFFPLAGLGLGLLLFMPLYLIRAMGAGDVKLLAMVGAFLGPAATFVAALASMIVGGVLAIVFALARGTAQRMFHNLLSLFYVGAAGRFAPSLRITPETSAGKLPYGIAIAIGTIGSLVLHQSGFL